MKKIYEWKTLPPLPPIVVKFSFFAIISTGILIYFDPNWTYQTNVKVGGFVDPRFEAVKATFRDNFRKGWDREGASFAVYYRGNLVVDLWGGFADREAGREWKQDTLSIAFSVTKAVTALCASVLIDRGHMQYGDLVTKYWPEFGQNGKENVTVRMLLSHQAGLSAIDKKISAETVRNRSLMSEVFEKQKPNWPPGSGRGYHMYTYGWLVDQLFSRVEPNGRNLSTFYKEEFQSQLDLDFHIGLPLSSWHRVARVHLPGVLKSKRFDLRFLSLWLTSTYTLLTNAHFQQMLQNPAFLGILDGKNPFNTPEYANLEIPAANGMGTARSIAKLFSQVERGKILSQKTLRVLSRPLDYEHKDAIMGIAESTGHGFFYTKNPKGEWLLGHPGYGGQDVKVDLNTGLAYALLTTDLHPDYGILNRRLLALEKTLYDCLDTLK